MHKFKNSQTNSHTLSLSYNNYLIFVIVTLTLPIIVSSQTPSKPDPKMADFVGTYKFEKDDGKFDDFLKAMGVSFVTRKVAVNTSPTIEVSAKDDGTYVVTTTSTFKTSKIEFKLGQEFEENRMDGETVKTTITKEGNKLIQKQVADPPVEIVREFTGDKMITTCKCKDVVNVREYKKVA